MQPNECLPVSCAHWLYAELVSLSPPPPALLALDGRAGNAGGFHSHLALKRQRWLQEQRPLRSGKGLRHTWTLTVGCAYAQVPDPFVSHHPLAANSIYVLSMYEDKAHSSPAQNSMVISHCSLLLALLKVQASPTTNCS